MKTNLTLVRILSLTILAMAGIGSAQAVTTPVPVTNPSFEDPTLSSGSYTDDSIPGWIVDASGGYGAGVQYPTSASFYSAGPLASPASGNQDAYIQYSDDIYQEVGALLPDTTYTLTLAIGQRYDATGTGFFELVNGTTDADTVLKASPVYSPTPGYFESETLTYTTDGEATGNLTIVLEDSTGQANFDNVGLTASTATPEPSTYALLLAGLVLLATHLRRRMV